jgi:hypothetical protein
MRTWRSGRDSVTKWEEFGERVMDVGIAFACKDVS